MLSDWARRWRVPDAAMAELQALTSAGVDVAPSTVLEGSEAALQTRQRVAATRRGWRLWRNNVGAFKDSRTGAWVRYGICNDSKAVNAALKSADLIGIKPVVITPDMVGTTVGQFLSREVKAGGWRYRGTPRECAQVAWRDLIRRFGGDAEIGGDL